jgi:3-oxoadipate enol-lactonase
VYYDYEDIKSLMDYLKVDRAHVCGLSMGSGIANDFALMYPDRCHSLISIGPWPSGYGEGEFSNEGTNMLWAVFGDVVKTLNEKGPQEATDYWWTGTDFVKSSVRSDKALNELIKMGYDYDYWGFKNPNKRSYPSPSAINRLKEIKVPTLIVTAEFDMAPCITVADLMEKEIKGSKKISLKDAGHCMNMDKP